ncbi:type III-B CRISPR module-associated protein Cmr5 [Hydrogenivirga sp. 128-5-R1-1]|uniref:type III-B CRISPR module-associated protein Cmr5 n=1 Tax=Hydrogenivirga sp. 128-5-R1-1 TaxID=392423 RepID=UPI00015EFEA3|nr:type III-B CRISPR module-associated protein Cmr5 [Hydrogenivirga sp. 128-5-R1-1]EDP73929.1 hypothetical protein HG1285_07233 [Hydrogenivirga sp. 128-5-R1-1]
MNNKTLEQKRASYAFEKIKEVINKPYEKDFSSLIGRLPTLILTNGLGNTLSFLFSKGKNHHLMAIAIISDWLFNETDLKIIKGEFNREWFDNLEKIKDKNNIANILNPIVLEAQTHEYIFATEETLRLLNWLKRFSEAMLKKGD